MKFSYFYLIAVLLHTTLSKNSGILVVLKHCANSFNKKYVDNVLTPRKPINRTTSLTSLDIYLKPGVAFDSPTYIQLESFKKFGTQYKTSMVKYKGEVCEGLKIRNHPLFGYFSHKTNETDNNILNPCPIKGHLFMKPYYTSYEFLPPLLPTGMWRTEITLMKGLDEKVLTLLSYYEITATGIEEF